ncbi:interferon regulatory factor 7 isoform X2 [Lampris incognitus]|uniref:interferon regulatory factor 7 isoform X2 n=1 Tax=Lampris incognitus TaxID=2546036 RepID=UPI0024B5734E|nr:interferon regulatory factor 7 isoform X2 [Lampris incognitus]
MQSSPKPQFAGWLIEQVETGQYAGLRYVESNKFRVPWKHNSRKDCNDEDSKIFRAWAVASGKINEFPNDKAKWKTNFRCALNNLTKRFRMIKDNSKNSEDPHKIYEIINTEYNYESQPIEDSADDFDMTPDIRSSPIECFTSGTEHILFDKFMTLDLTDQQAEQQWSENYAQHNPAVPSSYPAIQSTTAEPLPVSQNHTLLLPAQLPYYQQNPEPVLQSSLQPSIQDLEISIHYRGREMLKIPMSCSRLQFHYQHEAPELNAHSLCFPTTETLLDRKQIEYTNRILSSIQRGLLLEVRDTGIYACRQDRCHVFSSISPNAAHPDPRKLPQSVMVELLSFENFINELKHFKENNGGSPNYTVNMCFGEKFPDGKPPEKKLIVVKVVPLICRYFHEMAQMEGASSLHSANLSLQISNDNLFDLISSVFSLPAADELLLAV